MTPLLENYSTPGGFPVLNNDIAVLELAEEVDLDPFPPACLARAEDGTAFDGDTAEVCGWGVTASGGASSKLQEVSGRNTKTESASNCSLSPWQCRW